VQTTNMGTFSQMNTEMLERVPIRHRKGHYHSNI